MCHLEFKTNSQCSNFKRWREGQVDKIYVLCPMGKMLSKLQILTQIQNPIGLDFQFVQVKHFISRIQTLEQIARPLTEFEKLLIQSSNVHLTKIYKLLLAKITVTNSAKIKWQWDLQVEQVIN